MGVAGAVGGFDAALVEDFCGGGVGVLFAGAAGHEVGGDVVGVLGDEGVEFLKGVIELIRDLANSMARA